MDSLLPTYQLIAEAQKFERDYPGVTVEEALMKGVLTLKTAELIVKGQFIWEDVKHGVDVDAEDYDNSYYMQNNE
jgi:hypothetical protein